MWLLASQGSVMNLIYTNKEDLTWEQSSWANMGPIWGRQDPGGPHVGPMNFVIWVVLRWIAKLPCAYLHILVMVKNMLFHDDVIKWKHFPRYWPFVRGIYRSPVNSAHRGQWRGALMFSFICAWINGWANNREAGDWRRHQAHHDVNVILRNFGSVTILLITLKIYVNFALYILLDYVWDSLNGLKSGLLRDGSCSSLTEK